ncbi:hypothetical protein POM88_035253 [Heracleum sosnowskyi]|uniref:Uncharacterized protein n=1 Tax=Heracleum sosnowskyi TaxID=360622 RepID=A0AAD8HM37_9APIA|nr:hypothetical protein POM88_035253 [Heracleum sosnowskyi]
MMLVYLYKCQSLTLLTKLPTFRNFRLAKPIICSYDTKRIIPTNVDSSDFKISFLQKKCGLSGKALISACKCLDFDSSNTRPDSVIELFRTFGFSQPHIAKIISCYPLVLYNYHPGNILKPKLDFLLSIFQSQAEVVAIVTKNPCILIKSLNNHLIPSINVLNSVTGSYPDTLSILKYNPYIICCDLSETLLLNTQFLSALGVPNSQILKLLRSYGPLLGRPHDRFCTFVSELMDMGFDLQSSYFFNAMHAMSFVTDSTWESRCGLFRRFGFSNSEMVSMFKKLPLVMCYSEKNIKEKVEFFLNKLQWTLFRLSSYPTVLSYSLEKRIIPRCSVLQVLVLKNITNESYMLSSILVMAEKKFFKDFVTAHKDEVPEPNTREVPQIQERYLIKQRFDEFSWESRWKEGKISSPGLSRGTTKSEIVGLYEEISLGNYSHLAKDMGFDLESSYFLNALGTLRFVTDSTWESRCILLRSFGFSDHEILFMFKKPPVVMDLFLNKLHWTPFRLSRYPYVLGYSLKKRNIPSHVYLFAQT